MRRYRTPTRTLVELVYDDQYESSVRVAHPAPGANLPWVDKSRRLAIDSVLDDVCDPRHVLVLSLLGPSTWDGAHSVSSAYCASASSATAIAYGWFVSCTDSKHTTSAERSVIPTGSRQERHLA
jgi:hypothetical protein